MPDSTNPQTNPANPVSDGDARGPAAAPSPATAPRTFSEDYVTALRNESAGYRTQLRTAEKALKEFLGLKADDRLDDVGQALTAHKTAAQAALEKAGAGAKQLLIRAEVKVLAQSLDIVDADAAFALADLSKVQVAEDGKVSGVKEALEALLTAKPWLKKALVPVGGGTNPANPAANKPEREQLQAQLEAAIKAGRTAEAVALKNKIFALDKPK